MVGDRTRRALVGMAVGILAVTAAGVVVGSVVTGPLDGSVGRFDRSTVEALVSSRSATLDGFARAAATLTETTMVPVVWAAALLVAARWGRDGAVPLLLFVAVGGELLTFLLTSVVVGRDRPAVEPLGHVYSTGGFPSGHVAAAVALYGAIGVAVVRCSGRGAGAAAVVVAVVTAAVAWARLHAGHHFPSDVAWGVVVGSAWLALASRLTRRDARDERRPPWP